MIKPVRFIAGSLILISSVLVYFYSINWIFITIFVGLNLMQYTFTNWCLMEKIFLKLGYKE
ncbi:MAG: YgaP family membrane protein [Candidatus Nanoarchaeia archaeon]